MNESNIKATLDQLKADSPDMAEIVDGLKKRHRRAAGIFG